MSKLFNKAFSYAQEKVTERAQGVNRPTNTPGVDYNRGQQAVNAARGAANAQKKSYLQHQQLGAADIGRRLFSKSHQQRHATNRPQAPAGTNRINNPTQQQSSWAMQALRAKIKKPGY